jgi:hypothetical protein
MAAMPVKRLVFNRIRNHRAILNSVGKRLGVKELDEWYAISFKDILDTGQGRHIGK